MLKFEKILSDNQMSENDPELPSGIANRIAKIREAQKQLAEADGDEKAKIEEKIKKLDDEIMAKLPEHFDMIDEEEEKRKAKEAAAAAQAEEKRKKDEAAAKEKAQREQQSAAEKKAKEDKEKADKEEKERQAAAKKAAEEEENKPATSDLGALEKLHKKGKTTVTKAELKAAGFNTGFFGSIGPNGCTVGKYRLYREDPNSDTFQLLVR